MNRSFFFFIFIHWIEWVFCVRNKNPNAIEYRHGSREITPTAQKTMIKTKCKQEKEREKCRIDDLMFCHPWKYSAYVDVELPMMRCDWNSCGWIFFSGKKVIYRCDLMKQFSLKVFLLLTKVSAHKRRGVPKQILTTYISYLNRHLNQSGGRNEKFVYPYLYCVLCAVRHEIQLRMQWFRESFLLGLSLLWYPFGKKQFIILKHVRTPNSTLCIWINYIILIIIMIIIDKMNSVVLMHAECET